MTHCRGENLSRRRHCLTGGILFLLGALLLTTACGDVGIQEPAVWTILGPGGGGSQFHPTVSPHDSREVLVGCDMTGSYITHDDGAHWRMFNLGEPARFFVFDPVAPATLYVGAGGLWRSTDYGATWRLVYPAPATITGIVMQGDHAHRKFLTSRPYGNMLALAVDPASSSHLYAAVRTTGKVFLYLSNNSGKDWQASGELPGGARAIYIDSASPEADRTLYVAGESSIAVRDRGQWWQGPPPDGKIPVRDISLGFPGEGKSPVAYAVTGTAVYRSLDGGRSWAKSSLPGKSFRLKAVATSLNHPDVAYVSYNGLLLGGTSYLGVAKTEDRGKTWKLVWKDSREKAGENVHDNWLTKRFGAGWPSNPFTLGVAPNNPDICYGTDFGRTMRTLDGGKAWEGVYSSRQPDGSWRTRGLDVTTCYGVHFDPFNAERMFISYTDIGLFVSENGGRSWSSATKGVPRRWVNTTYWIVFDPKVEGRVWGVASGTHDLPRPKMWMRRSPSTFTGGVIYSEDGCRSWRVSSDGMPQTAATHILLDPASPVDSRVLYVAGFGRGVFKSVDGGKSWVLHNNGLEGKEPFAWRLAMDTNGALYLVVARRSDDGSIGNEQDGALYRSTDGAQNWMRVPLPEGVNGPNGLAVDPRDPRRLYLAVWGRSTENGPTGGGIYLSTDGGASWRNVLSKDQHIYDVTIDPSRPDIVYASGFESSAWRSTDRGENWKRIPGYNFKWGHRVIPDPRDRAMIYITTFGGSLWHGMAEGDPHAVEDIVTPEVAYGRNR